MMVVVKNFFWCIIVNVFLSFLNLVCYRCVYLWLFNNNDNDEEMGCLWSINIG